MPSLLVACRVIIAQIAEYERAPPFGLTHSAMLLRLSILGRTMLR